MNSNGSAANIFVGGGFHNTTGFVIRKSALLTGSLVVTAFRSLVGTDGPYAPRGVDNDDAAASPVSSRR